MSNITPEQWTVISDRPISFGDPCDETSLIAARRQRDELAAALKEILVGAEMEQCANFQQSESCRRLIAKICRDALAKVPA